jgi:effector-binding domain-containing protein
MGSGAHCSWTRGTDEGDIRTHFIKEYDSIAQRAHVNGTNLNIYWSFKDTLNQTKVTVSVKGKMDILTKITSFFQGGIHDVAGDICKNSLKKLDKTLEYEMKTYSIKVNGITQRNAGYCLKQTVSCHIKSITKNIKIMMPRMVYFFNKNHIRQIGKPYVIYEQYDPAHDFATISVCMPVNKEIFVMPGSDISSGSVQGFTCLKTTLTGDYSHRKEAWDTAKKYISDKGLKENYAGKYIEVYSQTIDENKRPSQWVTEIYIPVFPVAAPQQPEEPVLDENTTETIPVKQ